jgi:hypothetical protein
MASTLPAASATVRRGVAILNRDLRASDRDREQAVAQLKVHYADGRLADHELAMRSEAAYRAVGMKELERLLADLPRAVRRRRPPVLLPLALFAIAIAAWLVMVPPEVTLTLVLVFIVLALLAAVLLSPLWIPALLAFAAYRLIRTRVSPR